MAYRVCQAPLHSFVRHRTRLIVLQKLAPPRTGDWRENQPALFTSGRYTKKDSVQGPTSKKTEERKGNTALSCHSTQGDGSRRVTTSVEQGGCPNITPRRPLKAAPSRKNKRKCGECPPSRRRFPFGFLFEYSRQTGSTAAHAEWRASSSHRTAVCMCTHATCLRILRTSIRASTLFSRTK